MSTSATTASSESRWAGGGRGSARPGAGPARREEGGEGTAVEKRGETLASGRRRHGAEHGNVATPTAAAARSVPIFSSRRGFHTCACRPCRARQRDPRQGRQAQKEGKGRGRRKRTPHFRPSARRNASRGGLVRDSRRPAQVDADAAKGRRAAGAGSQRAAAGQRRREARGSSEHARRRRGAAAERALPCELRSARRCDARARSNEGLGAAGDYSLEWRACPSVLDPCRERPCHAGDYASLENRRPRLPR
jgi:hypothetical protein